METGKTGEELAEAWLIQKGFEIMERNWRFSHYEIDIIAMKKGIPHFVEVKTRSSYRFGPPENKVKNKKINFLLNAADEFLFQHPTYRHVQFDILSITMRTNMDHEYFFIEDVYL